MTVKLARSCVTSRSFGSSLEITGKFTGFVNARDAFNVLLSYRKVPQSSSVLINKIRNTKIHTLCVRH